MTTPDIRFSGTNAGDVMPAMEIATIEPRLEVFQAGNEAAQFNEAGGAGDCVEFEILA